jgi:putative endonuclease
MQRLAQMRIEWTERALLGLDRLAHWRGRGAALPPHLATGISGEDAAYFFLRRKGYKVVARRWSAGAVPGDIDLIAWQGEVLCFIEVKTRTARDQSPAEIAVDEEKRLLLRRQARQYLRQLPLMPAPRVRFDVLSVYLVPGEPRACAHFEGAFAWGERRSDSE